MKWQHWIVFALIAFVLIVIGAETITEYIATHGYYFGKTANSLGFFETRANRSIVLQGALYSLIPLGYLWFTKKIKSWPMGIALYFALLLFGLSHMAHKGQGAGGAGTLIFAINMLIMQGLATYFIMFIYGIGSSLNGLSFKFEQDSWTHVLMTRGMGLGVHLLINHFLIVLGLFHPIILRVYFLGGAWLIKREWPSFGSVGRLFSSTVDSLKSMKWHKYVFIGLIIMSILYVMFGSQLSFIPYPTAWDANHAYFLYPKIFALEGGYPWGQGTNLGLFLRLSYISFWFGLFVPFGDAFWLSPDSVALVMNFLSGIFVLVFGVVAVRELLSLVKISDTTIGEDDESLFLGIGWFGLILRLTSGMGAFLVFVDNKTDLGVLSLVILALLSGFSLINKLQSSEATLSRGSSLFKYTILSGLFFALAVIAKPTAFVDVFTFALFFVGLFVGIAAVFGIILLGLGLVAKIGILNSKNMLHESKGLLLIGLGVLSFLPETVMSFLSNSKKYIYSFALWAITLVVTVVVLKSPHVLHKYFEAETPWTTEQLFKNYLMSSTATERAIDPDSLLTTTASVAALEANSGVVDEVVLPAPPPVVLPTNDYLPLSQCSLAAVDAQDVDELFDRMKTLQGGGLTEDVGRYIGFGQKRFTGGGVGNSILRLLYPVSGYCYTSNDLASELCNDRANLGSYGLSKIQELAQRHQGGSAQYFLGNVLNGLGDESLFESDLAELLGSYWMNRTVLTTENSISVPYRYIIPFNVVQNWSLQNESSYYTDIGFIWLLSLGLLLVGFIYSLLIRDRKLFAISVASMGGWALWIVIGGGIVWYGLGLIVRLVLANVVFLYRLTTSFEQYSLGKRLSWLLVGLFVGLGVFQWGLNVTRIAKQGGGGAFVQYKQSEGTVSTFIFDAAQGRVGAVQEEKVGFGWRDVFDLQFGHYDPFLNAVADRDDEDGIYIAGTYAQYFLYNQANIKYDGLARTIWLRMSDDDVCASYLRLQDQGMKYFVIDPNIATVVMGQGNSSLFDRFLYKSDQSGERISNGVLAQLAEMVMADYMTLTHSSNLGISYAYSLSSAEIAPYMAQVGETDEVVFRTKMAGSRFFSQDAGTYQGVIGQLFAQRVNSGLALQDFADVFGKVIDYSKLAAVVANVKANNTATFAADFEALTQDERFVYVQYMNTLQSPNSQQLIQQLLRQSLGGGSQIALWKLM